MSIIGPSEHHQCCNGALPDGRSIVGQSEHDWRCNGALPGGRSVAGASRVSTYLTRSKLLVDPIYTLLFFLQCRSLHKYLLLLVLDERDEMDTAKHSRRSTAQSQQYNDIDEWGCVCWIATDICAFTSFTPVSTQGMWLCIGQESNE